ncbi:MAG: hypothetical protein B7Z23_04215, partial [Pseudomonadales bacterium 32-61-5]
SSGSRSLTTSPRNVYETSDGRFIAISASIQQMAERVFRAIGRPDMIEDLGARLRHLAQAVEMALRIGSAPL